MSSSQELCEEKEHNETAKETGETIPTFQMNINACWEVFAQMLELSRSL